MGSGLLGVCEEWSSLLAFLIFRLKIVKKKEYFKTVEKKKKKAKRKRETKRNLPL
jgi:hypothetical protein